MSYQRASEVPRKGRTEQEHRVERLLVEMGIAHLTNQVVCFSCRAQFHNPNGDRYPDRCINCFKVFDDAGQYCMPDFIIGKSILNINGGIHDKNQKHVKKDRFQIAELRAAGYVFSVLMNAEVDNMTNATLKAYLHAVAMSGREPSLNERFYRGEREYACLRV
jgi:hypothetical protein